MFLFFAIECKLIEDRIVKLVHFLKRVKVAWMMNETENGYVVRKNLLWLKS